MAPFPDHSDQLSAPILVLKMGAVTVAAALLAGSSGAAATAGGAPRTRTVANVSTCRGWVALTFDDGPSAKTPALVLALQRAGMKATFFNVGARAQEDVPSVRAEMRVGAVENHTYSHPFLDLLDPEGAADEILGTSEILTSITKTPVKYWRAPFNRFTAENVAAATSQGLTHASWTIDSRDWEPGATTATINDAIANVHDQDIVLLHDGYDTSVNAIPDIAKLLKAKGLCSGKLVNAQTPIVSAWGDQSYVKVAR